MIDGYGEIQNNFCYFDTPVITHFLNFSFLTSTIREQVRRIPIEQPKDIISKDKLIVVSGISISIDYVIDILESEEMKKYF